MRYLNAAQSARILGIGDKTIRRWLKEGKKFPSAIVRANGEWAIPENEVEELKSYRLKFSSTQSGKDQSPDITALAAKVAELEQEVQALKSHPVIDGQEAIQPDGPIMPSDTSALPVAQNRPSRRKSDMAERELPEGAILARHFAEMYEVSPDTFRDHFIKGLGPKDAKEKAPASHRPKPGREKELEWYLTPSQQSEVLAYWDRHGVPYQRGASEEENIQSADNQPAA